MLGPLTYLDAAVVAVAFISGLLAMYRGVARELLSIVSWAAAGLAVAWVTWSQPTFARDIAVRMGTQELIAKIAIGAIVFLIVLIIVHLITARISDAILDSRVGMIDRIFGFAFGAARGFLLIVIPFLLFDWLWFNNYYLGSERGEKPKDVPAWVDSSLTLETIVSAGKSIHLGMIQLYDFFASQQGNKPTELDQQGSINARDAYVVALTWRSSFRGYCERV